MTIQNRLLATLVVILWAIAGTVGSAQRRDVPLEADKWETVVGKVEFVAHKGVPAMVVTEGAVKIRDLSFVDGTIEFDIDPKAMGGGVGFRFQGLENSEFLYFRPQPNCETQPDCVQYAPFARSVLLWDLYPQYQGPAPIRQGDWNHVKVVVSGRRMRVFVNGAKTPSLDVGSLEGDARQGQLILAGPAAFKNVSVTTGAVEGLASEAVPDPSAGDARLVRDWQVAPPSQLPEGREPALADLPGTSAGWQAIRAERGGLVNLSRAYGLPNPRPARSLTWLTTTIRSSQPQSKRVAIGWAREVWVFVNGQLAYKDANLYQPPTARKPPDGRLSLDNGSFELPLKAGDNEIAVAIANNFFGWGLMLRLDDVTGVQLARK